MRGHDSFPHFDFQSLEDNQRETFRQAMKAARKTKSRFQETVESKLGEIHLQYGELFGLFRGGKLIAGFCAHNLAMFPQSFPKPDLTFLPPERVWECGEMWSNDPVGAMALRLMGLQEAKERNVAAILVYPIFKPYDLTAPYRTAGYVEASEPIVWPYIRMDDKSRMYVQPMVLRLNHKK